MTDTFAHVNQADNTVIQRALQKEIRKILLERIPAAD
jgi:hypothetical protein